MNRHLSFKVFLTAMLLILITGIGATLILDRLLNPEALSKLASLANPVTTAPVSLTLNLSSPDDNVFTSSADILVQGKTAPNATVIISTDQKDFSLQALGSGEFSMSLNLTEGVNNISVGVFDDAGNSKRQERQVYYSSEKI